MDVFARGLRLMRLNSSTGALSILLGNPQRPLYLHDRAYALSSIKRSDEPTLALIHPRISESVV